MSVRSDWVPTQLQSGDELGSFPGNPVPPEHDLAALYGVSARQIVEGNGVSFNSDSINAWVLATGGTTLDDGQPVLSSSSVILLPPGGPRSAVGGAAASASSAPAVQSKGGGGFLWLLLLGGAGWGAYHWWKNRKGATHA